MKLLVNIAEVFVGDVGIYLSGCDISVAQEGLYRAQIGPVFKQIGGK